MEKKPPDSSSAPLMTSSLCLWFSCDISPIR